MTMPDRETLRAMVRDAVREALAELKPARAAAAAPQHAGGTHAGLVTEKTVAALPEGAVLRLASGAVVTPLARDRARARGIKLERVR
jgi:hypothetical protein